MKAGILVAATLMGALTLSACPPATDGCVSNADCPEGEICNVSGECKPEFVPAPRDSGGFDRARPDAAVADAAPEDAPIEDAFGVDLYVPPRDAGSIPDGGAFDAAAAQQVAAIVTCAGPRAVVLNQGEEKIFVACEGDDTVHVYSSVVGRVNGQPLRDLYALPTPCKPRALHLREDLGFGQLWVACSELTNQKVFNVDPEDGSEWETGIDYGGGQATVRFASGDDLIAWVGVGDTSYYLRQSASGSTSVPVGGGSGAGINRASDVAALDDGTVFFFNNTQDETRRVIRRDDSNGSLPDYTSPLAYTQLIEVVPDNDLLIVANSVSFSRMDAFGSQSGTTEAIAGTPLELVVRSDSAFAYLAAYDQGSGDSTIYEISTDPGDNALVVDEQVLSGCQAGSLDAATDGRVFVACVNANLVRVLTF